MSVVNLETEHYERLTQARSAGSHDREFETAWKNGRVFARADDGLRGRPPWSVEWKGPHKPPGYEQVPADLRIDHVYLVSCKYGSSILHNVSPSHLFERSLAEKRVERGNDWFITTAPEAYQEFYRACLVDTGLGYGFDPLPPLVADLDKSHRVRLKAELPKRGRLPDRAQGVYEEFSLAVARESADRWRSSLTTARQREAMLWRLLRLQAAPYFVLGATTSGDALRYRVGTPWDFRNQFEMQSFDAWPDSAGQPMVRWRAEVTERQSGEQVAIEGHDLPVTDDGILEPLDVMGDRAEKAPRKRDELLRGSSDGILESLGDINQPDAKPIRSRDQVMSQTGGGGILESIDDMHDAKRRGLAKRELFVEPGMVLEHTPSKTRGKVVKFTEGVVVVIKDQLGSPQSFEPVPGLFRHEGELVALRAPLLKQSSAAPGVTASGSIAASDTSARVARPSRIWVEGIHDAELVERVWGDDLRYEGIVVEQLEGADDLAARVRDFGPSDSQRLGVLLDHLVDGSKETRIAAEVHDPNVLILGHPYVDIWEAIKPAAIGISAWPTVPMGESWKQGVLSRLGIGLGIGADDAAYEAVGAKIVEDAAAVFAGAEMIVKVKEPQAVERAMLTPDHLLFTYLHLAPDPDQTADLVASGATCIAYETVTSRNGGLPLLAPMSKVAGRMSIQAGAHHLESPQGGAGLLLGGVPGVPPAKVVVIGGGVVGENAIEMAVGMGADVSVLDRSGDVLDRLAKRFGTSLRTIHSNAAATWDAVTDADLVVGAVLIPGAEAPKIVTEDMVRAMRPGSVLVDVAIDQGGCMETSHATTHAEPTYLVHDVVHYAVANMPGGVPRTSTYALNNETLPFTLALANKGAKAALEDDEHLRNGLNVAAGQITDLAVAEALGYDYVPPLDALK
ncbi:Alanine dehydrogenase [Nymphon striatum]|nr:Alanine dehydrogenase [Nymphon striatum]